MTWAAPWPRPALMRAPPRLGRRYAMLPGSYPPTGHVAQSASAAVGLDAGVHAAADAAADVPNAVDQLRGGRRERGVVSRGECRAAPRGGVAGVRVPAAADAGAGGLGWGGHFRAPSAAGGGGELRL